VPSTWRGGREGPKGVATGDLDGDGTADAATSNLDGTVTVLFQRSGGEPPSVVHLHTGVSTLRDIALLDFTGDERLDIAAAAVLEGEVVLFTNLGGGTFDRAVRVAVGPYARDLVAGDFDGDGDPDLAVAGSGFGLRLLIGQAGGGGAGAAAFQLGPPLDAFRVAGGSTRPVYALGKYRPAGASADSLVAAHAWSEGISVLRAGAGGVLALTGSMATGCGVYAIALGALALPAESEVADLVTVHRDCDWVEVRRGTPDGSGFGPGVHQHLEVPGRPRAAAILDLNGDGWNDLAVALRELDRVLVFRNSAGLLEPSSELPVGRSPRDLAAADFDLDLEIDLAVVHRDSGDVAVLTGYPGQAGFSALDQVYLVDGEVADLVLADLNVDGRDDVVQLHRASGDVSVRLAGPGGVLGGPRYFDVADLPNDLRLADLDGDGVLDAVTANIGERGSPRGSISVRFGDRQGGFGPERRFTIPDEIQGALFSLEVADFDGDEDADVAAGFFDCRLAFFEGRGDGSFVSTRVDFFTYEARAMVSGDFDLDGDADLAGAGFDGSVVVLENLGDILTRRDTPRIDYRYPDDGKFGTNALDARDLSGDGDLDLVVGSGDGVMVFLGERGVEFRRGDADVPGTAFPVSSLGAGDFDGDGDDDVAVSCRVLSCVTILTNAGDGELLPALAVEVPAAGFLAAGDVDGDGFADLVGSGDVLWTALSSRRARRSAPPTLSPERTAVPGPVINEILAVNNAVPLPVDNSRTPDWVELYNSSPTPFFLTGWQLVLEPLVVESGAVEPPRIYAFPPGTRIEPASHLLLVFSESRRSPYHTGFRVPGAGGTLRLRDAAGRDVDVVRYPEQRENLSYARYRDGLATSFTFNNFPTPADANVDGGAVAPVASLDLALAASADPGAIGALRLPRPGEWIRFHATGDDDVGIVGLSLLWERADDPAAPGGRVILFDDGMHRDGGVLDGSFAGVLAPGLPPGAEIRLRMEAIDLSGTTVVLPQATRDSRAVATPYYSIALPRSRPSLEISEVVSRNDSGLRDEHGGTPDWVEVRNCGAAPVSLSGVKLGDRFPMSDAWFSFPPGRVLSPGEHIVVFCDGNAAQGSFHAPFTLRLGGGTVFLIGTTESGAYYAIDAVRFGAQQPDQAFARATCGGAWITAAPTPGAPNPASALNGDVDGNGRLEITDAIAVLDFLFGEGSLVCPHAADVNASAEVDISDAVFLLRHLFLGGPAPQPQAVACS
jgi:hypothetical protein